MDSAPAHSLTDREAQIMDRLWTLGTATADEIRQGLLDDPHDSTVRTLLRILEEKGSVRHRREGRSFVYQPVIQREKVQRKTLGNIIRRFFSGSPQDLVLRLLEDDQLSAADLAELIRQASTKSDSDKSRTRKK